MKVASLQKIQCKNTSLNNHLGFGKLKKVCLNDFLVFYNISNSKLTVEGSFWILKFRTTLASFFLLQCHLSSMFKRPEGFQILKRNTISKEIKTCKNGCIIFIYICQRTFKEKFKKLQAIT